MSLGLSLAASAYSTQGRQVIGNIIAPTDRPLHRYAKGLFTDPGETIDGVRLPAQAV